ncbi:MAG: hypothetical protein IPP71_12575 [Bacteroidetes bacterium]|nr:hypothetical protein [Bacteroidota bacterium]
MNRIVSFLLVCLFIPTLLAAGQWVGITSNNPTAVTVALVSTSANETVLSMNLQGYYQKVVETPRGDAATISAPETSYLLQAGAPEISKFATSIIIPDFAKMKVDINNSTFIDYTNVEIAPSKGSILRTVDPSAVPFIYGDQYNQDTFFPGTLAKLQDPFIVRDFRGQTVWIYPFQYNPVSKVLRVYTNIQLTISVENQNGQNVFNRVQPLTAVDREFSYIYSSLFKNAPSVLNYTPLTEEGTMLIISKDIYISSLDGFVEWKAKRGVLCEIVDVATIGNTSTAIKNFITTYYASNNLKYVLLVGGYTRYCLSYIIGWNQ